MIEVSKQTVLTLPNGISTAGYIMVHQGIKEDITTPAGLTMVGTGRVLDLADGWVARRFDMGSEFGGLLDAGLDKKATKEIHDAVAEKNLIPEVLDNALIQQEYAIGGLTAAAMAVNILTGRNRDLSPSRNGKHAMALKGLMLGAYSLAETLREEQPKKAQAVRLAGHVFGAVGIFTKGIPATTGYAHRIF